jgi:hypothetical protein
MSDNNNNDNSNNNICPLSETIHSIVADFLYGLEDGGRPAFNSNIKNIMHATAAVAVLTLLTTQAHIAQQHSGVDLAIWRRRMHEEARLTVAALTQVGIGYPKNDTLWAAVSEVVDRSVLHGEVVSLRLREDGWYAYKLTDEDMVLYREALERGNGTIDFGDSDKQLQFPNPTPSTKPTPQVIGEKSDEMLTHYLKNWTPGDKSN